MRLKRYIKFHLCEGQENFKWPLKIQDCKPQKRQDITLESPSISVISDSEKSYEGL